MNGIRLLIDTSKCIGCKACQVTCQQWHSLPAEDTTFTGTYQNPRDLTAANLTVTKFFEAGGKKPNWHFFKDQCRHCDDPPCMEECPFQAIIKLANGAVWIDYSRCFPSKCSRDDVKPCQDECEFKKIPRYKYVKDGVLVRTKMIKCNLCFGYPKCQIACPPGAISIGEADPILAEAVNRVNALKGHGFPDARIYPGQSDDPTHVIWIVTNGETQHRQGDREDSHED